MFFVNLRINEKKNCLHSFKQQRDEQLVGFEEKNRFLFTKNDLVNEVLCIKVIEPFCLIRSVLKGNQHHVEKTKH